MSEYRKTRPESSEWQRLEDLLGVKFNDSEEYGLIADLRPQHVARGREFLLVILGAFRRGRAVGQWEARLQWGDQ